LGAATGVIAMRPAFTWSEEYTLRFGSNLPAIHPLNVCATQAAAANTCG
jgi:hypothetical protein